MAIFHSYMLNYQRVALVIIHWWAPVVNGGSDKFGMCVWGIQYILQTYSLFNGDKELRIEFPNHLICLVDVPFLTSYGWMTHEKKNNLDERDELGRFHEMTQTTQEGWPCWAPGIGHAGLGCEVVATLALQQGSLLDCTGFGFPLWDELPCAFASQYSLISVPMWV